MLTKKQIEAAGRWLKLDAAADACCNKDRDRPDYDGSGCDFLACEDCAPRVALSTALAAYERMVAALDQYGQPASHDPEAPLYAALRRAVEGQ